MYEKGTEMAYEAAKMNYDTTKARGFSDLTSEEVFKNLYGHDFMDEIDTCNKYLDYACALEKEGKSCVAKKVYEMAWEECTHAKFQKHLLLDNGFVLTDEQAAAYDKLKERVHTLFR